MKVIHVMTKNIEEDIYRGLGNTSILVAFLSVLKWKSFGFTTKIYVDEYTKDYFSKIGLLDLYDEVDDTYFTSTPNIYDKYNINKHYFWAFSKLFVYLNETEPFIMADMDFIPLKDYHSELDEKCLVFYKEELNKDQYPNMDNLPTAENYSFPEWFTWNEKPCNMCFSYINDSELKNLYLSEAIRYASNNTEEYNIDDKFEEHTLIPRMVFAEQRLLSECAKHLDIEIKELKTRYEFIFNTKAIHLFGYKDIDFNGNNPINWIMFFLDKLNKEFPEVYSKLIELEQYTEYREKIEEEGFVYETPKMLKITSW